MSGGATTFGGSVITKSVTLSGGATGTLASHLATRTTVDLRLYGTQRTPLCAGA